MGSLLGDETINILKLDRAGRLISDDLNELLEVVTVVPPSARMGIAAALSVDEAIDLD